MMLLNEIDAFFRANLPDGAAPLYERAVQFLPLTGWLLLLVVAAIIWLVWKSRTWWLDWTLVQKCRNIAVRRALPKAEIFSIAIAKLEGDEKDAVRTQLLDALRGLVEVDVLRFDRKTTLATAGNARLAEAENHNKAQSWLVQSKAHILIWGQIMPANSQHNCTLRLHFTTRDTKAKGSIRISERQVFEFPVVAQEPLAVAVRSQVLAQLSKFPSSHPVAQALLSEITLLQNLVDAWPKGMQRTAMQFCLGDSWHTVGLQTGEAVGLQNSITAYKEVLVAVTREHDPLNWAATQNNLGNTLRVLGEREKSKVHLEAAVLAYHESLKVRTRDRLPLDWAGTQTNLGAALQTLGAQENSNVRLEEAVTSYKEALKECTQARDPINWAITQNNLGNALSTLGMGERSSVKLNAAVTAYQEALKEYTRKTVPLYWAGTQNNLGNTFSTLGELENRTDWLESALKAYKAALKIRTREAVPMDWAETQNNLGTALQALGLRESGSTRLKAAVNANQEALKVRTRESYPLMWAQTQCNLGIALCTLGDREKDKKKGIKLLEDSVKAINNAISEFEKLADSYHLGRVNNNLERAQVALARRKVELMCDQIP
jgi:tetratricopeptide (TPR) repeat protein